MEYIEQSRASWTRRLAHGEDTALRGSAQKGHFRAPHSGSFSSSHLYAEHFSPYLYTEHFGSSSHRHNFCQALLEAYTEFSGELYSGLRDSYPYQAFLHRTGILAIIIIYESEKFDIISYFRAAACQVEPPSRVTR